MTKLRLFILSITGIVILILILLVSFADNFWGAARLKTIPVKEGNFFPDNTREDKRNEDSGLKDSLLKYWSSQPLTDWGQKGKVKIPRIILACLFEKKRIPEINDYLCRQQPTGVTGSVWGLNPNGDYDFTLMALTPLLYLFGDKPDLLYPETVKHLINTLLTAEGGKFEKTVPKTLGLIEDTENHLLMINGSRYLKNRWLWMHGHHDKAFNNHKNGLQRKLLRYLLEIYHCGLYEFNSEPYEGYTLSALLNLHAFGGDSVRLMAERILDRLNWEYALGSYHFKRFPPFRRRYDRAGRTSLNGNYQAAMMKTWVSSYTDSLHLTLEQGKQHALWAAIMPYRLPRGLMDLVLNKVSPYYVKVGHGWNASPEIYSVGRHYFLSAGGVNRGKRSMIVARPIILITDPAAIDLREVFHVEGPGKRFMDWNNTGVYKKFACAAGPVHIPPGKKPVIQDEKWKLFLIEKEQYIAVYSTPHCGIITICHSADPKKLLHKIQLQNTDENKLATRFYHPDGDLIEYDLQAPSGKWVITAVNDQATQRDFDSWPFFDLIYDKHEN